MHREAREDPDSRRRRPSGRRGAAAMSYDETQEEQMPPKALAAFFEYKLAGPEKRSFRKMADAWEKAGKGKALPRQRQLERWSKAHEWQRLCEEWDRSKRAERFVKWEQEYDKYEGGMIDASSGVLGMTLSNLQLLLEDDNR